MIYIALDLYCLLRILLLIVPPFLRLRHKLDAVQDVRIARAVSLLALDIMTVAPDSANFNLLADFIPRSIGALLVIGEYTSFALNIHS